MWLKKTSFWFAGAGFDLDLPGYRARRANQTASIPRHT